MWYLHIWFRIYVSVIIYGYLYAYPPGSKFIKNIIQKHHHSNAWALVATTYGEHICIMYHICNNFRLHMHWNTTFVIIISWCICGIYPVATYMKYIFIHMWWILLLMQHGDDYFRHQQLERRVVRDPPMTWHICIQSKTIILVLIDSNWVANAGDISMNAIIHIIEKLYTYLIFKMLNRSIVRQYFLWLIIIININ